MPTPLSFTGWNLLIALCKAATLIATSPSSLPAYSHRHQPDILIPRASGTIVAEVGTTSLTDWIAYCKSGTDITNFIYKHLQSNYVLIIIYNVVLVKMFYTAVMPAVKSLIMYPVILPLRSVFTE